MKIELATECFVCGTSTMRLEILCPTCDRLRVLASIPDCDAPFVLEAEEVN